MAAKQEKKLKRFLQTEENYILSLLRITLGVVMFVHGAQKLFGWFGGYGFSSTMEYMTGSGIPVVFAFLAIIAESIGSLFLVGGFLSRLSAFGICVIMVVAVSTVHIQNGFFMNWSGNAAGEGFEYHILAFVMSLSLMIKGGGAFSLDNLIASKIEKKEKVKEYKLQEAN